MSEVGMFGSGRSCLRNGRIRCFCDATSVDKCPASTVLPHSFGFMTLYDEPLPPVPPPLMVFWVSCVPPKTTHHAKSIVKIGRFSTLADKPELVAARAMLESVLLPYQPAAPIRGAVALSLVFTWPWLSTHPKKFRARGQVPHTSKPDCSNVAKTLEDRLVALRFIEDDKSVVELRVSKFWGDEPGIAVTIRPLR